MANTNKEKELKTNWPIEDGIIANTTKQTGHIMQLIPEEVSYLTYNDLRGMT
jgi:hypothetical protein